VLLRVCLDALYFRGAGMINDFPDIPALSASNQNSPCRLLERSKRAMGLAMISTLFDLIETMPREDQLFTLEDLTTELENFAYEALYES